MNLWPHFLAHPKMNVLFYGIGGILRMHET